MLYISYIHTIPVTHRDRQDPLRLRPGASADTSGAEQEPQRDELDAGSKVGVNAWASGNPLWLVQTSANLWRAVMVSGQENLALSSLAVNLRLGTQVGAQTSRQADWMYARPAESARQACCLVRGCPDFGAEFARPRVCNRRSPSGSSICALGIVPAAFLLHKVAIISYQLCSSLYAAEIGAEGCASSGWGLCHWHMCPYSQQPPVRA